jgi:hypothetical protein
VARRAGGGESVAKRRRAGEPEERDVERQWPGDGDEGKFQEDFEDEEYEELEEDEGEEALEEEDPPEPRESTP